ncbi:MAG: heavy-metal-associated domain-containing protein [Bosea sp. (in: a-proteobacteria)]
MQHSFDITGMHCGACVARVRQALAGLGNHVEVTLSPPRAVIESDAPVVPSDVTQSLAVAGNYGATPTPQVAKISVTPAGTDGTPDSACGFLDTYRPLFIIVGLILLVSFAAGRSATGFDWHTAMNAFMAGFFLVFGGFKLFDLQGFAAAYANYDLLAQRWPAYGLVYPFLELGLGIAYLFNLMPLWTNVAALLLMGFSSLGVVAALRRRQTITCACLGTSLKLPMSTITLVEDLAMVVMAGAMLSL